MHRHGRWYDFAKPLMDFSFSKQRTALLILLLVVMIAGAGGGWIYLHRNTTPRIALLLPQCDAVFYVDLDPIRTFSGFGQKPVARDPDYQQFIDATGFQFERDLRQVALAVHPPEAVAGSADQRERRYSEVLSGAFDSSKIIHYLHKLADSVEPYGNTDIFLIPHEGRSVRVAILDPQTVAISNTADAANIKGIIDRFHAISVAPQGPDLLRDHYRDVPLGSTAWGILRFNTPDGLAGTLPLPNGIGFGLPKDTVTVMSVRYLGSIRFKAEALTQNEADSKKLFDSANTFLQLFRAINVNTGPSETDTDVKAFFDSLKVEQNGTRSSLSATVPAGFIKKMVSEAPSAATNSQPLPETKTPSSLQKKKLSKGEK